MDRLFAALGAGSALVAVAAGAFGAHALRARLAPHQLAAFETGARYQMFHALAMIAAALVAAKSPGWVFQAGIVLFSGSLYALALTDVKALGAITPIGGVAFLVGWIWLAVSAITSR